MHFSFVVRLSGGQSQGLAFYSNVSVLLLHCCCYAKRVQGSRDSLVWLRIGNRRKQLH
jgi:hypothetical protein